MDDLLQPPTFDNDIVRVRVLGTVGVQRARDPVAILTRGKDVARGLGITNRLPEAVTTLKLLLDLPPLALVPRRS
jgi:hypothetical protein